MAGEAPVKIERTQRRSVCHGDTETLMIKGFAGQDPTP